MANKPSPPTRGFEKETILFLFLSFSFKKKRKIERQIREQRRFQISSKNV
jgi:hypothetical protein